jgi:sigma-B regulation protein RsbU (phosphoserine phosphatase)
VLGQEINILRADGTLGTILDSAAPLRDGTGRIIGAVAVAQDITERKRAEETLAETKNQLERQVHLLQRALVPAEPPTVPGYSVASACIPAFVGTEIGGDFLDVFYTEDGKVGLLIGDVSGKGIESAAMAAAARSTVRAFAYHTSSPGDALTHTNAVLVAQQDGGMHFVTTLLAILDPATGDISYSSAGHPPAIISGQNVNTELIPTPNMPLGVVGGLIYLESRHTLSPGDRLVLYTDGITEARYEDELFGEEGIGDVLSMHRCAHPNDLVEALLCAARDWAHGKLRDDTTVLIVERGM